MRNCYTCKQEKPLEDFVNRADAPHGKGYQCKECMRAYVKEWRKRFPEKHVEQVKRWQQKNPEKRKANAREWARRKRQDRNWAFADALRGNHGITAEQYQAMHDAQNGKCAICGTTESRSRNKKLVVDHCHATERIRGLLCHRCNAGLGFFQDNIDLFNAAIAYLTKHLNKQKEGA
jgi:hypothetical protein